jgi:membrane-bound lytic murein transglycosylase A
MTAGTRLIFIFVIGVFFVFNGLSAFEKEVRAAAIERVDINDWPVFEDDEDLTSLIGGLSGSIAYFERLPAERKFFYGPDPYTAGRLASGLRYFRDYLETRPESGDVNQFLRKNGILYAHKTNQKQVDVLFTGYFEPALAGSLTKTNKYRFPVYGRPNDLAVVNLSDFSVKCDQKALVGRYDGKAVVPYFSRAEIESGALAGKADPIAWVSDPVALFFLHVQGSGRILLENGTHTNVHYDISNGLAYKSIGKYLIDEGKIAAADISMQSIADYIRGNPGEQKDILQYNPRYIFFKIGEHGVRGCLNVALTGGRSVALDQGVSPSGSLMFISSRKPVCDEKGEIEGWADFSRFAVNQDTGAAIRGPLRADLFWGSGRYAETAAGHMKHPGRIYFIVIEPDR